MRTDPAPDGANPRRGARPGRNGGQPRLLRTDHANPAYLNRIAALSPPRLTVIVATRPSDGGLGQLLDRLGPAVAPLDAEVIFVINGGACPDDLAASARRSPVQVRVLCRPRATRWSDRGSAARAGLRHARGSWALVLNAGLGHPPEAAAVLASTAMRHDSDIVVGTRYAGGKAPGEGRGAIARGAARLAKCAFPRRLAMVSDPLSGMFIVRTAAVDPGKISPFAFRMLLDILVRHPGARVSEVAYAVPAHRSGQPTAQIRKGLAFMAHLIRLRLTRLAGQLRAGPPTRKERIQQLARMVAFGVIGLSGLAVNTAALWLCYGILGWNDLVAAALATQASTAWNFLLVDLLIYRRNVNGSRVSRGLSFFVMNNVLMLARLPVLAELVRLNVTVPVANALTLVVLFLARFLVSDRAIFGPERGRRSRDPVRVLVDTRVAEAVPAARHAAAIPASRKRSRYLAYRYDVAGVVTIGSQIMLPELEFFRAQWVADADVDITVRTGDVGNRAPRRRAAMTEYADPHTITYEEHLGRLGANFRAHLGDPISVEVGPLLSRSSHVVYTNIIEPLLRFVMVSRGRMLLHSACVEIDGVGVMLSALTDTGKTGTVLRLLREHGGRFLSDDMTVIDAYGNASCFPKPLTISSHTVRAVRANDLTRAEWRRLQLQSRLHSKGGRSIGMALSHLNLPIMGINALTQMLIPPPKYTVDRLVPCRMTSGTKVSELFIIERGRPKLADLDEESALEQLVANTDDAYGFPPFRYLAPAINIGGKDYEHLRLAEREILARFLSHLRIRVLASDSFGWADEIPRLILRDAACSGGPEGSTGHHGRPVVWPSWGEPVITGSYL